MNINFGLLPPMPELAGGRKGRADAQAGAGGARARRSRPLAGGDEAGGLEVSDVVVAIPLRP